MSGPAQKTPQDWGSQTERTPKITANQIRHFVCGCAWVRKWTESVYTRSYYTSQLADWPFCGRFAAYFFRIFMNWLWNGDSNIFDRTPHIFLATKIETLRVLHDLIHISFSSACSVWNGSGEMRIRLSRSSCVYFHCRYTLFYMIDDIVKCCHVSLPLLSILNSFIRWHTQSWKRKPFCRDYISHKARHVIPFPPFFSPLCEGSVQKINLLIQEKNTPAFVCSFTFVAVAAHYKNV